MEESTVSEKSNIRNHNIKKSQRKKLKVTVRKKLKVTVRKKLKERITVEIITVDVIQ